MSKTKPFEIELTEQQIKLFWSNVDTGEPDKCWPWKRYKANDGYGVMCIRGRVIHSHRTAWIIANKKDSHPFVVRHSCDNRECCNPAHLTTGTGWDNALDRDIRGRRFKKLTRDKVEQIRLALGSKSQHKLGRDFGVSQTTVWEIASGKTWTRF